MTQSSNADSDRGDSATGRTGSPVSSDSLQPTTSKSPRPQGSAIEPSLVEWTRVCGIASVIDGDRPADLMEVVSYFLLEPGLRKPWATPGGPRAFGDDLFGRLCGSIVLTAEQLYKLCVAICETTIEYKTALNLEESKAKERQGMLETGSSTGTEFARSMANEMSLTVLPAADFLAVLPLMKQSVASNAGGHELPKECVEALLMNQILGSTFTELGVYFGCSATAAEEMCNDALFCLGEKYSRLLSASVKSLGLANADHQGQESAASGMSAGQ